jgi:hypothetical protein
MRTICGSLIQKQKENDARLKGKVQPAAAEGMLD